MVTYSAPTVNFLTSALRLTCVWLAWSALALANAATSPPTPWMAELEYPSSDLAPIVSYDVTKAPYHADPNGKKNSTKAFQRALADADSHGGTVFAPAGRYRIDGNLTVPMGVTLRGDWKAPTEDDASVGGTILLAYADQGNEDGPAFITVEQGAIRDLNIFYPEQSLTKIQAYPTTINLTNDAVARNITLVNSYRGILTGSFSTVFNVYATTLNTGIHMLFAYAVPRCRSMHFSPRYWSESGLERAPRHSAIRQALHRNQTFAIQLNRQDAGIFIDVQIDDYHTGVKVMPPHGWTFWHNLDIRNVAVGIHFTGALDHKLHATGSSINASDYGILMQMDNSQWKEEWKKYVHQNRKKRDWGTVKDLGSIRMFDCSFSGSGSNIFLDGSFDQRVNLQECVFESWGQQSNDAAIQATNGQIWVYDSEFKQASHHIVLDGKKCSAEIIGNQFSKKADISAKPSESIVIDHTISRDTTRSMKPIVPVPNRTPARTGTDALYVVTDRPFRTPNDGEQDASAGIQSALDAAGKAGGGTVYLPQGRYRLTKHLTVPAGVELRGTNDFMPRAQQMRTLIIADIPKDRDKPNNPPLISLESAPSLGGSGVSGLGFWYPHQDFRKFSAYPYTVQGQGPKCWVQRVYLGNCYNAVDFGTHNNDQHVLSRVTGSALNIAFKLGNSPTIGWVDNCHIRPQDWQLASEKPNRKSRDYIFEIPGDRYAKPTRDDIFRGTEYSLIPNMRGAGTITIGSGANVQITAFFTNGSTRAFDFIDTDGTGGGNANILIGGSEAGWGALFEALGTEGVTMVNFSFSAMTRFPYITPADIPDGHFPKALVMRLEPSVGDAPFTMIMGKFYGRGDVLRGIDMRGGNVLFKQGITVIGFQEAVVEANGGTFRQRNNRMGPVTGPSYKP